MDELNLIAHITGSGEGLAERLRQTGLTDLKDILAQEPADLAARLNVNEEAAVRIIKAAKTIAQTEAGADEPELAVEKAPAEIVRERRMVKSRKKSPVARIKKKEDAVLTKSNIKEPLVDEYWKKVLPILFFSLVGYWIGRRG